MLEKNIIWERAGRAGLALGGVSVLYLLYTMLSARAAGGGVALGMLVTVLNLLFWTAKLVGSLWLLRHFMRRFSQEDPAADNARVFRFGTLTALLSALLYSAVYLAYTSFIAPDTFAQAIDILRDSPMMDARSLEMMEEMLPKMPTFAFFTNLIYCWLFGTVAAAVFSRNIPPQNPFIDQQ